MRNSKKIALTSILSALSVIFLYILSIIPTARLATYVLIVCMGCVITIECGIKHSLLGFIVTSLLSFFIIPEKIILIPYILFLGYYPILKLFIERINKLWIEIVIKLILGSLISTVIFYILGLLDFNIPIPTYILIPCAVVVFIIFDVALSLFIKIYREQISNKIR